MVHRLSILVFGFFGIFLLILLRLFFWQVVSSEKLSSLAERQRSFSLTTRAERGRILGADGSPFVINQRAFLVYAEPQRILEKKNTLRDLSLLLQTEEASLAATLYETDRLWVPLAHKVEENVVKKIEEKGLQGIGFLEEPKRFYPEASMAAHLLGFVGKNSKGEDQGYFGVEGYYNEQLSGKDGVLRREADALGHPILLGLNEEIPPVDGRDLSLSVDKTIQYIAESKLKKGIERYEAQGGTVTILDPMTGQILAMVAFPSYDPGFFEEYPEEYFKNPIIASTYEPGSTFKVLVMAAAINESVISPETVYEETGPIKIGGYTIQTWNQKYHGHITTTEVLQYSSNVGMVDIVNKLGGENVYRSIQLFGFGQPTDVDLQEETSPSLRAKNQWKEIDYATASFGQGIAVTPLQMVRGVAAIANGGKLLRPYIVKRIQPKGEPAIEVKPHVIREVFDPKTAAQVTEMMTKAVENGETKYLKNPGLRIAGKTGTAQIPIAGHYDMEKTIASFVGFGPIENPAFVMLVTIVQPTTSPWGSETAAPVFFDIAKELHAYLQISRERRNLL